MYPTLPAGSRFLAKLHPYKSISEVKRGDIIVFVREENGERYNYIWRVIGLPGETIEVEGKKVSVNGHEVKHEQVRTEGNYIIVSEEAERTSYEVAFDQNPPYPPPPVAPVTMAADQFFVLGDNRFNARDSSYFGPIDFSSIAAKKF